MIEKKSKIDLVLDLDRLTQEYRVRFEPQEAYEFLARAGDYNRATARNLSSLIERINGLVPPMRFPGDNPNNGHTHHWYLIGREGSRVIYLKIAKAYFPKPFPFENLYEGLKMFAESAECDEYDLHDQEESVEVRMWWD